jgi:hypothetical protein
MAKAYNNSIRIIYRGKLNAPILSYFNANPKFIVHMSCINNKPVINCPNGEYNSN